MKAALVLQNMGVDLELDVGTSNVIKSIYRGVEKAGHEIDVIMPARRAVAIIADIEDLDNDERPLLGFSQSAPFILVEQLIRRIQRWLKLPYFSFIDSFRFYQFGMNYYKDYSLVHEYYNIFSIGAAVACKRLGKPYVVTSDADQLMELELTGQPLKGIHKWVAEWETKYIYDQAYKIICVSEPAIKNLIDRWGVDPDKIVLIPNGVNLDLFTQPQDPQAVRAKLGIGDKPVVMFVGGFQPWHGIDGLLTSFKDALTQVPEAQLVLVGDGPVRTETEAQIAQLGLTDCVHITGFVPHPEVVAYLSIADVVTIPYPDLPRELWFSPFKLYEYMAAGKAMVASRSGQIADVITDGENGRLVTPGNLQELTNVMVELLQDPTQRERLAQNAFQQAVEKHSLKQYGEKITAVYAEAIQN